MSASSFTRRRGGFTLLELMVVVAIVGVLAAVAIPNYLRFQQRARSAEAGGNLAAIRLAQNAYYVESNTYASALPSPPTHGGSSKQDFVDVGGGFGILGWEPEGQVYFNYAVTVSGAAYTADASADLDEDGTPQVWGYLHPDPFGASVAGALSCTGVWDPFSGTGNALNLVGPCAASHGRSVF